MSLPNLITADSLGNKRFGIFVCVHPPQMLFEIIKPRPLFVRLRATLSKTLIFFVLAMLWPDLVDAFLMSHEIVKTCKAFRS